jgi:hypothetical protein
LTGFLYPLIVAFEKTKSPEAQSQYKSPWIGQLNPIGSWPAVDAVGVAGLRGPVKLEMTMLPVTIALEVSSSNWIPGRPQMSVGLWAAMWLFVMLM